MGQESNSGCLGILIGLFGGKSSETQKNTDYPYGIRDNFLSAAELQVYQVLRRVIPEEWTVLAKVRIADILYTKRPNENFGAQNKIQMKHVDFVLCEVETMKVLAAVELDDSSHNSPKTQKRDELVNGAFAAAGMPLIRFRVRAQYDANEVANTITAALDLN